MDGNYDLKTMVPSLKKMGAVKVTQMVIQACIGDLPDNDYSIFRHVPANDYSIDSYLAKEIIISTNLPRELEEMVESLIKPMMSAMGYWHHTFGSIMFPIWTSHGTVDLRQSVTSVLRSKVLTRVERYALYCEICSEKDIVEMARELVTKPLDSQECSKMEEISYYFPINFWSKVLRGDFGEPIDGTRLPQFVYDEGFECALRMNDDVAIRYFIDKASPEVVRTSIYTYCVSFEPFYMERVLPATLCLLFSKVHDDQRQDLIQCYSKSLLMSLLKWPYQCFFLEAACSVFGQLDINGYWYVMGRLIYKIAKQKSGYNYHHLIVKLWQLGSIYRDYSYPRWYRESVFKIRNTMDEKSIGEKCDIMRVFCSTIMDFKLLLHQEYKLLSFLHQCCNLYFPQKINWISNSIVRLCLHDHLNNREF